MTNINFSTMTDAELKNLMEEAEEELNNRIEAIEQKFWEIAKEFNAIHPDYELFATGSYPITISDILFAHNV